MPTRQFPAANILAALAPLIVVVNRAGVIVTSNVPVAGGRGVGVEGRDWCPIGANYLETCRSLKTDNATLVRLESGLRALFDGARTRFDLDLPLRISGEERWFLTQATPVGIPSAGIAIVHTDITSRIETDTSKRKLGDAALRESQRQIQAILEAAVDAIINIDRRGIILSVNRAAEQMFGYLASELVGQNVKVLMPSPYNEQHDFYIGRYLETREKHIIGVGREVEARRKDGSIFPVDLAVSEVDPVGIFTGMIRDLTQRKQLEREVVEIASLQQRRIGQDLHDTVSQELTALTLLTGDLQEALATDPALCPKLAAQISQGLRRTKDEVRAILRGLLPVMVDQHGFMSALVDLAERTRQQGKVACVFDCPDAVLVSDHLVATHLYLIAQEAVHNAVKHAQARLIRIDLRKTDSGLMLGVHDDGIGPPRQTSALLGLGLRIMKNRAAIIGAKLSIEKGQPRGTLVSCFLRTNPREEKK